MKLAARIAWVIAGLGLLPALAPAFMPAARALCVPAKAGPLKREWVDQNAAWVIHFDVEAAMRSTVGRFLLAHRDQIDLGPLEEIRRQTGFDPLTDLKSLTVYATRDNPTERIRLLRATPALDDAIARMRQPDVLVQALTTGTWSLEAWTQDEWNRFGYVGQGLDSNDRLLIFSGNQVATARALEVQAGREPSLSALDADPAAGIMKTRPAEGSILFIAADDLAGLLKAHQTDSSIASMVDDLLVNITEVPSATSPGGSDCTVEVTLKAAGFEEATKLADLLRGTLMLGKQMTRDDPSWDTARGMLNAVNFATRGASVSIGCRWSTDTINGVLESCRLRTPAGAVSSSTEPGSGGSGPTAPPWFADRAVSP